MKMVLVLFLQNPKRLKNKKAIRKKFKDSVFKRDNYTCQVCGNGPYPHSAEELFDAHHITDRSDMPNGGYVEENGITVCKRAKGLFWEESKEGSDDGMGMTGEYKSDNVSCHMKVEKFHMTNGEEWEEGLHPDDLYKMIGSSKEIAIRESEKL